MSDSIRKPRKLNPQDLGVFVQSCPKSRFYRPANTEEVGRRARSDAKRLRNRFKGCINQKGGGI